MRLFAYILILVFYNYTFSQNATIPSIDSLEVLEHQNHAKVFLKILNANLNKPLTTLQKQTINTYKVSALVEAELFDEALLLSKELISNTNLDTNLVIKNRIKRALIYEVLGKFKKCENELKTLTNLFDTHPEQKDDDYGEYLFRYASFYRVQGEIDKALPYNKQSIAFAEANNYPKVAGVAYMVQGLLTPKKQYDKIKIYYYKALKQFSKNNDSLGISAMYLNLGNLYHKQKDFKATLKYCDSAINFSKPFSYYFASTYAYKLKSETFNALKQPDSAYVNYKKFHNAFQYISYDKQELKVNQLEYNFLVEKQQIERDQVFKNNKQLKKTLLVLLLLISLIALSAFLIFRKNKIIAQNVLEKEVLLKELHHRVKNNLSLILSLINFHAEDIEDQTAISKFEGLQQRIEAIAIVHEQMMVKSNNELDDSHNIKEYILKIAQSLIQLQQRKINFNSDIIDIEVSLDIAVPLGILINELISNSIKHTNVNPLDITLHIKKENQYLQITYSDSGTNFYTNSSKQSLGLFIIDSMISQLKGSYKREQSTYKITLQIT